MVSVSLFDCPNHCFSIRYERNERILESKSLRFSLIPNTTTGGYPKFVSQGFNDDYLPLWLQAAGYNTYYVGKLFNAQKVSNYDKPHAAGWTGSDFLLDPFTYEYRNATFQRDHDPPIPHEGEYSTDVVAAKAYGYLDDAVAARKPFFLTVAPVAPHSNVHIIDRNIHGNYSGASAVQSPPVPAERHRDLFREARVPRTPAFNPDSVGVKSSHDGRLRRADVTYSPMAPLGSRNWRNKTRRMSSITMSGTGTACARCRLLMRWWLSSSSALIRMECLRRLISSSPRTMGTTLGNIGFNLASSARTRKTSTSRSWSGAQGFGRITPRTTSHRTLIWQRPSSKSRVQREGLIWMVRQCLWWQMIGSRPDLITARSTSMSRCGASSCLKASTVLTCTTIILTRPCGWLVRATVCDIPCGAVASMNCTICS